MRRISGLLMLAALVGGGVVFLSRFDISIRPRDKSAETAADDNGLPPPRKGETIRIASFNIQVFGQDKMQEQLADGRRVADLLAEVIRRFDIVAIQEIRSKTPIMPEFLKLVNATGRKYDVAVGPRLGRTSSKEQYAYIYDLETVELNKALVYTVPDPEDLLHRPPLVAMFRTRGPPAAEAFTFELMNVHTDPDETKTEIPALAAAWRLVRSHKIEGAEEDDVILLGDLNVDDKHLGDLVKLPYAQWAIKDRTTNTRGTAGYDNLVFDGNATENYTGLGGVFDLVRELNLTTDEALKLSDHLPVWAEFSVREMSANAHVAEADSGGTKTR